MKIVQITDTHVPAAGDLIYGVDGRARLDACIEDVNRHHRDAELCLLTGDLVNHGGEAEYVNLKGALDRLEIRYRLLVGNHDDRTLLQRFFPDTPLDEDGHVQSVIDTDAGRLMLLDTHDPGKSSGVLCEKRLAWVERRLAEWSGPVYVFLHHPPLAVGIQYMDGIGLRNGDELWKRLAPHAARIRLVAFGHLHRPVCGSWHGIAFAGCPSTVHQVALELGPQEEPHLNFNHEPPCYAIFDLGEENVVAHQQRFTENWKTFPRKGKPAM